MRRITQGFCIGLVYLLFAAGAHSQESVSVAPVQATTPRWVQFNGVMQDSSGQPLSGVQGVTFALYKEQQGGAPLWLETENVTADDQGRYAVLLGSTQSEGLPLELFTSNEARWLGVQAIQSRDSNGAVLEEQPRVLLVSVPYALKAADAETLGGLPLSAFVLTNAAKAAMASTPLLADKAGLPVAAMSDGISTAAVSGTGTTNQVVKWTDGAAGTLGDSAIFESGGQVGIGTTNPSGTLDVHGDIKFSTDRGSLSDGGTGDPTLQMLSGANWFNIRNSSGTDVVRVLQSGNIGIGTVSPDAKLAVNGGNIRVTNGSSARIGVSDSLGSDRGYMQWTGSGVRVFNYDNSPLMLGTADIERMRIDASGNVGIGTTSAGQKLTVAGTIESTSGGVKFPDSTTQTTAMRTAALTRAITYLAGCDYCGTLDDAYDQPKIFYNMVGAMTINSVTCFSDTGTPSINVGKNGSNILSSTLTCSTSGSSTTSFSSSALNSYDTLDFVMVTAGGAAHRVTVTIQATIN